jgi:hypothetical protein
MSGSRKEALELEAAEETDRELYLRDGRRLSIGDHGNDQLVEIRSASGALELRIVLTETGPVLQMESVKLQLKASEAVEIESARVEIKASEDVKVECDGDVRVVGKTIHLN